MVNRKLLSELIRRITHQQTHDEQHENYYNNKLTTTTTTTTHSLNTLALQINNHLQLDHQKQQQFSSLLSRLSPLPHPIQKAAILSFLLALAPIKEHQHEPPSIQKLPELSSIQLPSAAQKLRLYRAQHNYPAHLPEHLLLRDMIYLLQGIDGRYVYFKQSNSDDESWEEGGIGFNQPQDGQLITLPQRDLILKLTELGWLYKKINAAIGEPHNIIGTVQQAFAFALKEELGNYYRAIAIIESHLSSDSASTLSSKALLLHLSPTVLRLRMSAALISATKGTRGGQMISVLHSYTHHGDPVVNLFTSNLLEKVSVPWFQTLVSWMWDGELVDPMEEFFIVRNPVFEPKNLDIIDPLDPQNPIALDGWNVWQKKFCFRGEMIPSFISEGFARKIFSTGKSLNFIRHSCGDYEWHQTRSNIYQASSKSSLHYKDITGLQQTIDSTYSIATRRLFKIFFIKLKLLDHLKAVKDYLLLGRGDFISLLIESLGPSLNKPANTLYRHNLTATLESAIRATSDERLLLNRLDYKTERPINLILSSGAMEKYMRMFRVLWKMKRLEYSLDRAWKVVILGVNRSLRHLHCLRSDFHRARLVISEMIHFIRQLQSYCHLEVIDCGWQEFEKKLMSEGGDLDSLIEGHSAYLDRLVSKGLLLSTRAGKELVRLGGGELRIRVSCWLRNVSRLSWHSKNRLSVSLFNLRSPSGGEDNLYAFGLSKSARLQSAHQQSGSKRRNMASYGRMQDSSSEGYGEEEDEEEGGEDEEGSVASDDTEAEDRSSAMQLEGIRVQLLGHSKRFTDLVLDLISCLSTQQDSDMKFLAVRLNFSLFYMRTNKSSSSSTLLNAASSSTNHASRSSGGSQPLASSHHRPPHLHHHHQASASTQNKRPT
ncbi:hypothetical protein VP01_158g9 [Puccinia sorghi]|uniref:Uncharacterized protein n=1 Tax=Puccinia sorghi TaxID=27349 RepID=A0A0L6VJC0_9BASI|nr:hypothetical protein VP01_158g9 [Puccinia sorghi]